MKNPTTEQIVWKVDGMTCANCALSIHKTLTKQGLQQVAVNSINGEVRFDKPIEQNVLSKAQIAISSLGYTVNNQAIDANSTHPTAITFSKYLIRFWVCLPFTLVLMLHMLPGLHFHWLMQPIVQLMLALPVYLIGMFFFGKSAFYSLKSGVSNMNVLITIGASAAFFYSVAGMFQSNPGNYLFFETAATIITIVFFGNWLEDISIARTQKTIKQLTAQQKVMAQMIAYDDQHMEHLFPVDNQSLKVGDLIMIRTGEQVPTDCKVLSGTASVSEALLTGESNPVAKQQGDLLVGGSVLTDGWVRCMVQAVGKDTIMHGIVEMMHKAQTEKPPVQLMADRISSIFVPVVLLIAAFTFLLNWLIGNNGIAESMMRSVAVLVIACPCAMGLATPAAIAVGLGRAAKLGILFTDVHRMELFRKVECVVFDKTGTLTTGNFSINAFGCEEGILEDDFKKIVFSLEKYSTHPIATSITSIWKRKDVMRWQSVKEHKGKGMFAISMEGDTFELSGEKPSNSLNSELHNIYLTKNGVLFGWLDITDELRPEAASIVQYCQTKGWNTILLSGDSEKKCKEVAEKLNITTIYAKKSPAEKMDIIANLSQQQTTLMVGDGINDAAALAKATLSLSLGEASHLAIQSASVVVTGQGISKLPLAIALGKQTYQTIKSNLWWAFAYNVLAIPIAAVGWLHPAMAALIMGCSDVVLAANSLWLGVKKIKP